MNLTPYFRVAVVAAILWSTEALTFDDKTQQSLSSVVPEIKIRSEYSCIDINSKSEKADQHVVDRILRDANSRNDGWLIPLMYYKTLSTPKKGMQYYLLYPKRVTDTFLVYVVDVPMRAPVRRFWLSSMGYPPNLQRCVYQGI